MRAAGILLSAGRSERFGAPKLLAPLAGKPLVLHAVDGFLGAGLEEVVVVVAPGAGPLTSLLAPLALRVTVNPDPAAGMLSSVHAGLAALSGLADVVAISPADIPGLAAPVVRRLLAAATGLQPGGVAVPVASGRRGHPILLSKGAARRVALWPPQRRLSDLLREPDVSVLELAGFGEEVLRDVDRPEDLSEVTR